MDLVERPADLGERHPWEQSRALAIESIVRGAGAPVRSILDYGCGDAYTGRMLLQRLQADTLAGIGGLLAPEQCAGYREGDHRVELYRDAAGLGDRRFDLVLLCDVIEHVADDVELLLSAKQRLASSGNLLVTVPAFPVLFSGQDRALKHFRRYTLGMLEASLRSAGFSVLASGYLFGSLLPVRAAEKLVELARGGSQESAGVGRWSGGRALTRALVTLMSTDNSLLLALARRGLKLPGLSAWALSKAA